MKKSKKKVSVFTNYPKWIWAMIVVLLLTTVYYAKRASNLSNKCSLLEGELANEKDQNAGFLRTIKEQAYSLGKRHGQN